MEVKDIAVTRRTMLSGLVAATAIGKADAMPTLYERIDKAARELQALMQELHGGEWFAEVDHQGPLCLIARESIGTVSRMPILAFEQ